MESWRQVETLCDYILTNCFIFFLTYDQFIYLLYMKLKYAECLINTEMKNNLLYVNHITINCVCKDGVFNFVLFFSSKLLKLRYLHHTFLKI